MGKMMSRPRKLVLYVCLGLLGPVFSAHAAESPALVLLYQQISTLKQEVRDLYGKNQILAHEIQALKKHQRELYVNLDQRLQTLRSATPRGGATATGGPADTRIPSTKTGIATGLTPTNIATSTSVITSAPQTIHSVNGGSSGNSRSATELAAYQKAFNLLMNSHYQAAIAAFTNFEKNYSQSSYIPNAEYWTGEALYIEKDYAKALKHFQSVVNRYPQSNKVSGALLKIGYCQYALHQWSMARKTLQEVISQYPGSTEAMLASDHLNLMKTQGH